MNCDYSHIYFVSIKEGEKELQNWCLERSKDEEQDRWAFPHSQTHRHLSLRIAPRLDD